MLTALSRYATFVPLILRLGLGTTLLFAHGLPKLLEGPERWESTGRAMQALGLGFAPMFWGVAAVATEMVGGLLLLLGLFVRPATAALLFVMFVAASQNLATSGNLTGGRAHPIDAATGLLALLVLGAGRYSLDTKLGLTSSGDTAGSRQQARAQVI